MASIPNVTTPVIINATTTLLIQSDFFLRRVCFVSFGDSTLNVGSTETVDKTSYTDILANTKSELAYRLEQFFAYASNKECFILECGVQAVTPLADTFQALKDFAVSKTETGLTIWYKDVLSKNEATYITKDKLDAWLGEENSTVKFVKTEYTRWLKEGEAEHPDKEDNLENLKAYLEVCTTEWQNIYADYLNETNDEFKKLLTKDSLVLAIQANPATYGQYPDDYAQYLIDNGDESKDYSEKISMIKKQIDEGTTRYYIYALPKKLYYYEGTGKLCQSYSSTDSFTYFAIEVDNDEALDTSSNFKQFSGIKSVIPIYNNGSTGYSFVGAFLGRFASSILDITESNPASPINYKTVSGFNFNLLTKKKEKELINNSVSFASDLVSNTVILNGRTADSRPFDYWYQWDIIAFNLQESIISLLLQGVNNPSQVIEYNQNGIDTLNATIKSCLNKMIDYGCLTEFAASYNSATQELTGEGYIAAISYPTYVAANPDKYAMEIYDGFSFYLRIGKYIRQVILNTTLG